MEYSRLPNRLKTYRLGVCLSQKQVAKKLGLSNTSKLSRWEQGHIYPSIEQIFRLCVLYKTIPQLLFTDLWYTISQSFFQKENNLLAQHEPFNN